MWTGTCEYPGPPSGLELIPDRGTVQDSWFGPQLQISNIGMYSFIGRLGIGRIRSGTLKKNTPIALSQGPGTEPRQVKG